VSVGEKMIDNIENIRVGVELCISKLVEKFKEEPLTFSEEKDFHYALHDLLCECNNGQYKVRWEYHTHQRYRTTKEKKLIPDDKKGKRGEGRFDLVVLTPTLNQEIPVAIEFFYDLDYRLDNTEKHLIDIKRFRIHVENDYEKLTNKKNKVKCGYMLYFIQGRLQRATPRKSKLKKSKYKARKDEFWEELSSRPTKDGSIKISQIEADIENCNRMYNVRALPEAWLK